MTIAQTTFSKGIKKVEIKKLLTDSTSEPTYDTAVEIDCVGGFEFALDHLTTELTCNNIRKAVSSQIIGASVSIDPKILSVEALGVLMGETVTVTGTSPNQKVNMPISGKESSYVGIVAYFGFADVEGADVEEVVVTIDKAKMSEGSMNFSESDFSTQPISLMGVKTKSSERIADIELNQTASA